jgi:hypothetical protein
MGISIKEITKMASLTERENISGAKVAITKVILNKEKEKGMEFGWIQKAQSIKDSFYRIASMEKEYRYTKLGKDTKAYSKTALR